MVAICEASHVLVVDGMSDTDDKVDKVRGMDITMVTTARTDERGQANDALVALNVGRESMGCPYEPPPKAKKETS